MTSSETHTNKKIVIGDQTVKYPDSAVTMDEDCNTYSDTCLIAAFSFVCSRSCHIVLFCAFGSVFQDKSVSKFFIYSFIHDFRYNCKG